jgi:hypothetical protein
VITNKYQFVGGEHGVARMNAYRSQRLEAVNRPEATWWDLAQDKRRAIFEETSHPTAIGLKYLPSIARRLHHARRHRRTRL